MFRSSSYRIKHVNSFCNIPTKKNSKGVILEFPVSTDTFCYDHEVRCASTALDKEDKRIVDGVKGSTGYFGMSIYLEQCSRCA